MIVLITDDQAPNSSGCKLLGINEVDADQAKGMIDSGTYETLVILQEDLVGRGIASTESLTQYFSVYLGTKQQFYLTQRVCHHNRLRRQQNISVAMSMLMVGFSAPCLPRKTLYTDRRLDLQMSMGRLDHYGTRFDNWVSDNNKIELYSSLGVSCAPLTRNESGVPPTNEAREIIDEIALKNSSFAGISLRAYGP